MPSPRQRYPLKRRALELSLPRVGEGHWTDGPDDDHKLGIYREKLEHERGQMEEARVKLAALEQQIPTDATKKREWEKIHKEQCNALKVDVIRHESSVKKIKEGFDACKTRVEKQAREREAIEREQANTASLTNTIRYLSYRTRKTLLSRFTTNWPTCSKALRKMSPRLRFC